MFLFFPIYFISILHRGFTESIKHTEDNKAHRKRKYSKGNSYSLMRGKWQAGTLVVIAWRWLKSDQTCTLANILVFPLTTARDRRWWSHCRSLWSPEMSTSFFDSSRKGQWTCDTHQWFRLQLFEIMKSDADQFDLKMCKVRLPAISFLKVFFSAVATDTLVDLEIWKVIHTPPVT